MPYCPWSRSSTRHNVCVAATWNSKQQLAGLGLPWRRRRMVHCVPVLVRHGVDRSANPDRTGRVLRQCAGAQTRECPAARLPDRVHRFLSEAVYHAAIMPEDDASDIGERAPNPLVGVVFVLLFAGLSWVLLSSSDLANRTALLADRATFEQITATCLAELRALRRPRVGSESTRLLSDHLIAVISEITAENRTWRHAEIPAGSAVADSPLRTNNLRRFQ